MLPVVRSGLSAASQEIAVISNNIANASSLGFKRSNANFSDVYTEMSDVRNANRVGNGVRQESPRRNHSQGSLILTGNALDLGMNGQGMFILDTMEKLGELSYTRNGAINVREDGKLVNSDGIAYLDIIRRVSDTFSVPCIAYQVSGEYAMTQAAVQAGWLDKQAVVFESMMAFKRAGASGILTYFAPYIADCLNQK